MTNAPKKKGTAAESAVVAFLRVCGYTSAERRASRGIKDAGDIAGIPSVVIEVKNKQRMDLAEWVDEAMAERLAADAEVSAVWHKRVGRADPGNWYVTMTGAQWVRLLKEAGY